MFNTPVQVPDRISTLELSKIWLYKAFQALERELEAETEEIDQPEASSEDEDSAAS